MKNARERLRAEMAQRARTEQASDQDTARISASQLAEVLARVDGDGATKGPERPRTISGSRPVVRPPTIRPIADAKRASSSPSQSDTSGIVDIVVDVVEGHGAAVERPVDEEHVVNATSPTAAASSGRIVDATSPDSSEATVTVATSASEPEATGAPLVASARRSSRVVALALAMAVIALVAVFGLAYRH